jgi:hypothetical protein
MFPAEFDLARTLNDERERDAARRRAVPKSSRTHAVRRSIGIAMVALGHRLIPAPTESPPRPSPVSNC